VSHEPQSHAGLDHTPVWDNVAIERLLMGAVGSGAGGLALACGGMLLVRRLSGSVTMPPGAAALACVCGVGGLLVAIGDLAAQHRGGRGLLATRIGFAMAALAIAVPLPTPFPALLMALVTAACAVALLVQPWASHRLGLPLGGSRLGWRTVEPPRPTGIPADLTNQPPRVPDSLPGAADWPTSDQGHFSLEQLAADEHLLQHQQRFTRADGSECIRGKLFLAVPTGVRVASGHVGFCPPFATIPMIDVTTAYDEVEAMVAAAEVLPWGVRIECRLDEPADESFEIPIDIVATLPPPSPQPATAES
jgi:hypothetical protein